MSFPSQKIKQPFQQHRQREYYYIDNNSVHEGVESGRYDACAYMTRENFKLFRIFYNKTNKQTNNYIGLARLRQPDGM